MLNLGGCWIKCIGGEISSWFHEAHQLGYGHHMAQMGNFDQNQ
jgi:hypothetical protein